MYTPIYVIEDTEQARQPSKKGCGISKTFLLKLAMSAVVVGGLAATYNACVWCVLGILVLSVATINCLPGMPVVFLACVCVLLYNVTDYKSASLRVEVSLWVGCDLALARTNGMWVQVPLARIVPTYDDLKQYIEFKKVY